MAQLVWSFVKDQSGATSIEYSIVAVGVAVAIVFTVGTLGSSVKANYLSVNNALH